MSFLRRRWKSLLVILLAIPPLLITVLGFLPPPSDPPFLPEEIIVGAQPRGVGEGVDTRFPDIDEPADNGSTPERVALGRALFFDPLLSANQDISCATCHHPDLGLSDGRPTSMGAGAHGLGPDRSDGAEMARNAMSLYEVAYARELFWDGRAAGLEAQAAMPLTLASEMATDPATLVTRLSANPDYVSLFEAAFPDQAAPVDFENVGRALAAFERTLVAHNSPLDRHLAGDETALTPSQLRGWSLFRSGATGCYRCHAAPIFGSGEFAATGVPGPDGRLDPDPGRFDVSGDEAERHAFRVPSLRNVALSGPYMHNGVFETLEEVVAFYVAGGGRGLGLDVANQDDRVRPIDLNAQEQTDLVNFLYALTDLDAAPAIPGSVPSGLPLVERIDDPATARVTAINAGNERRVTRDPTTLTVRNGLSIQEVLDRARSGDTIEISYGVYHERVVFELDDITIRGIPNAQGEWPVLDGQMALADGIAASGDNLTFEQLEVRNYTGNGIVVRDGTNLVFRDLRVHRTEIYGVYPVRSTDVLIERVEASGIRDAGIYAGQCRNVVIRDSEVYENVIGVEVENSINSEVYNVHAHNNSTGIFVDLLPNLPSKVSLDTRIHDNLLENNNHENFAREGEVGALVPRGVGILIFGADDVQVFNNVLRGNSTVGVAVFSTRAGFDEDEIDMPPNPERVHVFDNQYENNGYDAAPELTEQGIEGADVVWDVSNWDNRFDEAEATTFPPLLPSSGWPVQLRRIYWQILNFAINRLL